MISRELCRKDQAQHICLHGPALAGHVGHHLAGVLCLAAPHRRVSPSPTSVAAAPTGSVARTVRGCNTAGAPPPAARAAQHPAACDVAMDIKYLSGLSLLCLSCVGETKRQLTESTETFRLKCPQKLAGRLCLLNTVLRLTMPSAAPLPWGSAGSLPHEPLAALFWKKRNFNPHAPKCFQGIYILISRTASLTKTLR